ncbi:MAG: SpoIID/LytB domain-containing protein [Candidatus Gastranaerophilales bacterium]|nr:SpoIID/LytB domain-containing protein [Candidatus Gastranaerophilales bacterium]
MKIYRFILLIALCFALGQPAKAIKIGLFTNYKDTITVGVSSGGVMQNAKTGEYILVMEAMKPYWLESKGDYIKLTVDKKRYKLPSNEIIIKPTKNNGVVYAKKHWYKGHFLVTNSRNGLTLINDVDMEDYLKGVVPSEMPASWNQEAHKAQAIAARSYAIANLGKRLEYGYDLNDTPQDQNYLGVSRRTTKTDGAVEATRGQVLVYNDKVIRAYYCASAGGQTASPKDVWGSALPYLESVKSFDENVGKKGHGVGMSQHGANNLANMGYDAYQILGYFYKNVLLRKMY